jgi:hypothetical protein
MFLVLSSGVLIMFGVSVPSIANQIQGPVNCELNNIPTATCSYPIYSPPKVGNATITGPTSAAPFPACLLFIPSCFNGAISTITNTGAAIWNGLQQVAYAMAYYGIFAYVFFNKIVQGIFLIFGITSIMSTDYGIPLLQYFWLAFFVFYIMYGLSMLKPGGSGL